VNDYPKDWPLVDPLDDGIRSAGAPDRCFYYFQQVGTPHARDCVIVKKVVRLRVSAEVDIEIPHSWSAKEIREDVDHPGPNAYDFHRDVMQEIDHLIEHVGNPYKLEYVGVVDETPRRELCDPNKTAPRQQVQTAERTAPKVETYKELDESGCGTCGCTNDHSTLFLHCPNCSDSDSDCERLSVRYEKKFKEIRVACDHCEIDIAHIFIAPGINFESEDEQ